MKNNGIIENIYSFGGIKQQAANIAKVWKANRKFQLNDVRFEDFEKIQTEFDQLTKKIAGMEPELDELIVARRQTGKKLTQLNVRIRGGMRSYFGRQSSQFEQIRGGNLKRAVRLAKPAATQETPVLPPTVATAAK
jgi:hypothetical protein